MISLLNAPFRACQLPLPGTQTMADAYWVNSERARQKMKLDQRTSEQLQIWSVLKWAKENETSIHMPHAHDEMQLQKWQLALSTWIPVHVLMSSCPPVEAHLGSHSEACSPMTRPALQHLARGSLCIPTALGPPDVQPDTCHRSRRLWHLSSYSLIPTYTHEDPASIMKICEAQGRLHSNTWRTEGV